MRRVRSASAVLGLLVLGTASGGMAGEPVAWYVSAGAGANWASDAKQSGRNRDTTCYPDHDCNHLPGGTPSGYRWRYDLDIDPGTALEVAVGVRFDDIRLELSASQRKNDANQESPRISYLDGTVIKSAGNGIKSNPEVSVGDLTTRTLSVNAYYDFPAIAHRITPYLGAGLGLSFVEVSRLQYRSNYTDAQGASSPSLRSFNGRQDVDLSDTALAKHLYAGADYGLSDKTLLGLKLAYTHVGSIEDRDSYLEHKVDALTSVTKISSTEHWSVMITLKYLFTPGPL